jgi:hypothetical protein
MEHNRTMAARSHTSGEHIHNSGLHNRIRRGQTRDQVHNVVSVRNTWERNRTLALRIPALHNRTVSRRNNRQRGDRKRPEFD